MIEDEVKSLDGDPPLTAEPELAVEVAIESLNDVQQKPDSSTVSGKQWRNYPCRECDNVIFTSHGLLSWHRVQLHRPHKCQKCGKVFTGRQSFSQHVHKEHPGLPISKVFTACTGIV